MLDFEVWNSLRKPSRSTEMEIMEDIVCTVDWNGDANTLEAGMSSP